MKGQIIHKTAIDGERCRKKEKETDKQQTEKKIDRQTNGELQTEEKEKKEVIF